MHIIKKSQCQNVTKKGKVIYTVLILLIFRASLCQYILHFVTYPSLVCTACPCQMLLISPSIFISSSLWWCCRTFQVSSRCPCCLYNAKPVFPRKPVVTSCFQMTSDERAHKFRTYDVSLRRYGFSRGSQCGWPSSVKRIKTEFIRKLSNFNFQWTKTLYQNNLNHIVFFFYIFERL